MDSATSLRFQMRWVAEGEILLQASLRSSVAQSFHAPLRYHRCIAHETSFLTKRYSYMLRHDTFITVLHRSSTTVHIIRCFENFINHDHVCMQTDHDHTLAVLLSCLPNLSCLSVYVDSAALGEIPFSSGGSRRQSDSGVIGAMGNLVGLRTGLSV